MATGGCRTNATRTPATPPSEPSREGLLKRWLVARERREAAEPGGKEHIAASEEVAAIEVEIARVERAADPPLV